RALEREESAAAGDRVQDPEETPEAGVTERLAVVAVQIVAREMRWPACAIVEQQRDRLYRAHLHRAQAVGPRPARLLGPLVALDAEDVRLLAGRHEDVDSHGVASVRLQEWGGRIAVHGRHED